MGDGLQIKEISKSRRFDGRSSSNMHHKDMQCIKLFKVMKSMVMRHIKAQKFNKKPIVKMPDKKEDFIFVDFTPKQKEYYDKLYKTAKERFDSYKATGNIGR